ncbi:MAG: hypothetical protein II220_03470, partial [Spirochaetales bacterium]|nr:hypothetical protein [Spirochaetales bacterium]
VTFNSYFRKTAGTDLYTKTESRSVPTKRHKKSAGETKPLHFKAKNYSLYQYLSFVSSNVTLVKLLQSERLS